MLTYFGKTNICVLLWLSFFESVELASHVRVKRQTDIKNLSPMDRESCRAGGAFSADRVDTAQRLQDLRYQFTQNSLNLMGYIIPSEDAHQSEYKAEYDKRREYITGFTGSHGVAVVLRDKAALWTDGRYYIQADNQLDCNWILMKQDEPNTPTYEEWIHANMGNSTTFVNRNIGLSPYLISSSEWLSIDTNLKKVLILLVPIENDLIDIIWQFGRPARPSSKINALPLQFAGRSWQQKITESILTAMNQQSVQALILTQLDEIAWLFNLRGTDVNYNPFFLSYSIIDTLAGTPRIRLFIFDKLRKLTEQPSDGETSLTLSQHLNTGLTGSCTGKIGMCVEVDDYSNFIASVTNLNNNNINKFWISYQCNYGIYRLITKEKYQGNTPAALTKFSKNSVEQQGLRNAHKRDAVALITYLAKLEDQVKNNRFPLATETSVSNELNTYRRRQLYNRGVSFPSISAFGANSAIIHYTPSLSTNVEITTDNMFLLDSGGQYLDATTDVTRTLHFGNPTAYQKECYTRVLMGQIDLARFVFYKGAYGPYGREVDAIARRPLWEVGLDYRHGTGHGVGSYLSVHEGPGRISLAHPRVEKDVPLDEFQVFSDEPGYYEQNMFGVRLENIVMVTKANTKYHFMNSTFLGFETMTLVPYEPALIDYSLLSTVQLQWLDNYNRRVVREIGPLIANDTLATQWLHAKTPQLTSSKETVFKTNIGLIVVLICSVLTLV